MTDSTDKDKKQAETTETVDDNTPVEAPEGEAQGMADVDEPKVDEPKVVANEPVADAETESTPSAPAQGADAKPARENSKPNKPLLLWGVLVLLLVMLTGLGLGSYTVWQEYQQLDASIANREAAIDANLQAIKAINNELLESSQSSQQIQKGLAEVQSQTQQAIAEQNDTLSNMAQRLDGQQSRLNTLSTTSREDWLLAEAEYLLRLANQRVLLERSPRNAIALLRTADDIIKQVSAGLGDPELFAIRKTLGREITELTLVDEVDKTGVYIKLGAMADKVFTLPRVPKNPMQQAQEQALVEIPEQAEHWWSGLWQLAKESAGVLDQYIRIGESESAVKPLLHQDDALIVASNVQLLLQQAQLALLREDPKVYRHSLTAAEEAISSHYISSHERNQFLEQLKTVEAINVAPQLPDISTSLNLLNGFIQKLHKLQGS